MPNDKDIKEILEISGTDNLQDAFLYFSLIDSKDDFESVSLSVEKDWYRSGGETYIKIFSFKKEKKSANLILKACVAFSVNGIDTILNKWIVKRKHLEEFCVCSPKLYAYGYGMLLEEYIPFSLKDAYAMTQNKSEFVEELAKTYIKISHAQYKPIVSPDYDGPPLPEYASLGLR